MSWDEYYKKRMKTQGTQKTWDEYYQGADIQPRFYTTESLYNANYKPKKKYTDNDFAPHQTQWQYKWQDQYDETDPQEHLRQMRNLPPLSVIKSYDFEDKEDKKRFNEGLPSKSYESALMSQKAKQESETYLKERERRFKEALAEKQENKKLIDTVKGWFGKDKGIEPERYTPELPDSLAAWAGYLDQLDKYQLALDKMDSSEKAYKELIGKMPKAPEKPGFELEYSWEDLNRDLWKDYKLNPDKYTPSKKDDEPSGKYDKLLGLFVDPQKDPRPPTNDFTKPENQLTMFTDENYVESEKSPWRRPTMDMSYRYGTPEAVRAAQKEALERDKKAREQDDLKALERFDPSTLQATRIKKDEALGSYVIDTPGKDSNLEKALGLTFAPNDVRERISEMQYRDMYDTFKEMYNSPDFEGPKSKREEQLIESLNTMDKEEWAKARMLEDDPGFALWEGLSKPVGIVGRILGYDVKPDKAKINNYIMELKKRGNNLETIGENLAKAIETDGVENYADEIEQYNKLLNNYNETAGDFSATLNELEKQGVVSTQERTTAGKIAGFAGNLITHYAMTSAISGIGGAIGNVLTGGKGVTATMQVGEAAPQAVGGGAGAGLSPIAKTITTSGALGATSGALEAFGAGEDLNKIQKDAIRRGILYSVTTGMRYPLQKYTNKVAMDRFENAILKDINKVNVADGIDVVGVNLGDGVYTTSEKLANDILLNNPDLTKHIKGATNLYRGIVFAGDTLTGALPYMAGGLITNAMSPAQERRSMENLLGESFGYGLYYALAGMAQGTMKVDTLTALRDDDRVTLARFKTRNGQPYYNVIKKGAPQNMGGVDIEATSLDQIGPFTHIQYDKGGSISGAVIDVDAMMTVLPEYGQKLLTAPSNKYIDLTQLGTVQILGETDDTVIIQSFVTDKENGKEIRLPRQAFEALKGKGEESVTEAELSKVLTIEPPKPEPQETGLEMALDPGEPAAEESLTEEPVKEPEPEIKRSVKKPKDKESSHIAVNPKDIKVDAKRFQFKADVDPKTGSGKGLDIEKWDKHLAGTVLIWEDKNGERYIVNGHHRLQKARELGVDRLNADIIREVDGITDKDARLLGARINIAEGHGSVTDAAKLFREGGYTQEQLQDGTLPMNSGNAKKGYAIAQLTDNLFNKVVDKVITENQGAIIGEKIPADGGVNNARQEFILKQLMSKDMTHRVLEETIDAILNVEPSSEVQETLFGSELIWDAAAFETKPKIVAETKRIIVSDKNAFSKIIRNAETLKKVGNILQDDANVEQKDILDKTLELIDIGKYTKGDPISEIFDKFSAHTQAGGNIKHAAEQAAKEIVRLIARGEYISPLMDKPLPTGREEIPGQVSMLGGMEDDQGDVGKNVGEATDRATIRRHTQGSADSTIVPDTTGGGEGDIQVRRGSGDAFGRGTQQGREPDTGRMGEERAAGTRQKDSDIKPPSDEEVRGRLLKNHPQYEDDEKALNLATDAIVELQNLEQQIIEKEGGQPSGELESDRISKGERADITRGRGGIPLADRADSQGGERLLGLGFTRNLIKKGIVDFRGMKIQRPYDLAVAAQVLRDPRYETFRLFYVKGDEIVGHESISSRVPGTSLTYVFDKKRSDFKTVEEYSRAHNAAFNKFYHGVGERMHRLGADGYYILHNHPSGKPTPSQGDIDLTTKVSQVVPGFKAHVIINSGVFCELKYFGQTGQLVDMIKGLNVPKKDALLTPEIEHPLLGTTINSAATLASLAKSLELEQDRAIIFFQDAPNRIRAIQEVPLKTFKDPKKGADYLRERMREFGSTSVCISLGHPPIEIRRSLNAMLGYKGINDVVIVDKLGNPQTLRTTPISDDASTWMGEDVTGKKVQEEGSEGYSIDRPMRSRPWRPDFPKVMVQTNAATLKKHPRTKDAKAGDILAANEIIQSLVKKDKVLELAKNYPDAIVVPVLAEESVGRNKLPLIYAQAIAEVGNLEINDNIMQANRAQRTSKGALERLFTKVLFDGDIKPGYNYIIVDDMFTMGGTLAGLREHIEQNGGHVVAATTLAASKGTSIAVTPNVIKSMEVKFGREKLEQFLRDGGIAGTLESLTDPEARYLLKFRNVDSIRDRIAQERNEGILQNDSRILEDPSTEVEIEKKISPNMVKHLEVKFGREKLEQFLRDGGIAGTLESLTDPEARYLLKFRNVDSIRDRILETTLQRGGQNREGILEETSLESQITKEPSNEYSIAEGSQTGGFFDGEIPIDARTLRAELEQSILSGDIAGIQETLMQIKAFQDEQGISVIGLNSGIWDFLGNMNDVGKEVDATDAGAATKKLQFHISELQKELDNTSRSLRQAKEGSLEYMDLQLFAETLKKMLKKHERLLEELNTKKVTKASINEVKKLIDIKDSIKDIKEKHKQDLKALKEQQRQRIADIHQKQQEKEAKEKKLAKQKRWEQMVKKLEAKEQKGLMDNIKTLERMLRQKGKTPMMPQFERAAKELLDELNIETSARSMRDSTKLKLEGIKEFIEAKKESDPSYEPPQSLLDRIARLERTHVSELGLDDVRAMKDMIDHIIHQNNLEYKIFTAGRWEDQNESKNALLNSLAETRKPKEKDPLAKEIRKMPVHKYLYGAGALELDVLVRRLVSNQTDNRFYYHMSKAFDNAAHEEWGYRMADERYFENLTKGINLDKWRGKKAKLITLSLPDYGDFQLTKADRIMIYMHMKTGDPANIEGLKSGFRRSGQNKLYQGFTDKDLKAIVDSITAEEKKVADGLYAWNNEEHYEDKYGRVYSAKGRINKGSVSVHGYRLAKEKNYVRIARDSDFRDKTYGPRFKTIESFSWTKSRKEGAKAPIILEDPFRLFKQLSEETAQYAAWVEVLNNAKRIMGDKDVRQGIRDYFGEHINVYFDDFFYIVEGNKRQLSPFGKGYMKALSNVQNAILASPWIWVNQLGSIPLAGAELDLKYAPKALVTQLSKDMQSKMEEFAPSLWMRRSGMAFEEIAQLTKTLDDGNALMKALTSTSGKMVSLFDVIAINYVWAWTANEIKHKYPDLKADDYWIKVAEKATEVVQHTQPNYTSPHRSLVGLSDDPLVRTGFMFSTVPNKIYNMYWRAEGELRWGDKGKGMKILISTLAAALTLTARNYVRSKWQKQKMDEKDIVEDIIANAISPIYGLDEGLRAFRGYELGTPTDLLFNQISGAISGLLAEADKEEVNMSRVRGNILKLSIAGAQFLGIPARVIEREFENALKNTNWEAYNDYKSTFKETRAADYYPHLAEAVKKDNYDESKELMGLLVKLGTDPANWKNSKWYQELDKSQQDKVYQLFKTEYQKQRRKGMGK